MGTSKHRQNGLSYVPKKIITWMLREARGVLNRVQPDYHFISIVLRSFCFFQLESCVLWQAMLKNRSVHIGHCRPKGGLVSK